MFFYFQFREIRRHSSRVCRKWILKLYQIRRRLFKGYKQRSNNNKQVLYTPYDKVTSKRELSYCEWKVFEKKIENVSVRRISSTVVDKRHEKEIDCRSNDDRLLGWSGKSARVRRPRWIHRLSRAMDAILKLQSKTSYRALKFWS